MKIASPCTKLSRMLMDNIGLGVKFSRTLGNDNALLVTTKEVKPEGDRGGREEQGC